MAKKQNNNKNGRGRWMGEEEKGFYSLPSPPLSFLFLLDLVSNISINSRGNACYVGCLNIVTLLMIATSYHVPLVFIRQ